MPITQARAEVLETTQYQPKILTDFSSTKIL